MTPRTLVMLSAAAGVLAGMGLAAWRRDVRRGAARASATQREALQVWEDEGGAVPRRGHNVREVSPTPEDYPAVASPS